MEQKEENKPFDYSNFEQEAIKGLREGKALEGKNGVLTPLIKRIVEASLEGEMDVHLQESKALGENRRNGKMSKTVKTGLGKVVIETPRDRDGSFSPLTLPKRQTVLGEALDHKVISLYARGMSYNDICDHLEELYGLVVSPSTLTAITDRIIEDVRQWQSRTLESVYPFVWLDAIHYKVRQEGAIVTKAVYCVIGVNREGMKDLLGMYIGQEEGSHFWLNVVSELQNRGVKDIFIACIDNLKGFAEAIEAIFPETHVQTCVVHQIRNTTRYVPTKEKKAVMQSLKEVYQAGTLEQAEKGLIDLEEKWAAKYPVMVKSWKNNWHRLSTYFAFPKDIRRVIYTTNIIESFHSQLRKITKSKRVFSTDTSLLKLLYLVYLNLDKNQGKGWCRALRRWPLIYAQLMIIFENRMLQP